MFIRRRRPLLRAAMVGGANHPADLIAIGAAASQDMAASTS
jgi:hypothetical protein